MKKLLCLIVAILMLFTVACTETKDFEDESSFEESVDNFSEVTSDNEENSKIESSKPESSKIESSVSQEISNESSEPSYVFEPTNKAYGLVICDHGAIFGRDWFHYFEGPFVGYYGGSQTIETGLKSGVIPMTSDEFHAWQNSETPDEYKFECNVHDTYNNSDFYDSDIEVYKNKNIVMFVRQFNADREKLEEFYYNEPYFYNMYHDFDVLLDWEYQDACNWYLDYYNKYREILEAKDVLGDVRGKLVLMYESKEEWHKDKSVTQLIYENKNIPREKVEELIERRLNYFKSHNEKLHTGEVVISYKLDEVYNQSDEFMELLEKFYNGEIYTYQLDEWLMDIQYN